MSVLLGRVGQGGTNNSGDVRLIQRLLNESRAKAKLPLLVTDGIAGPKTNAAIALYQKSSALVSDGRVDRGGPTLKKLMTDHLKELSNGVISFKLPADKRPTFDTATTTDGFAVYWQKLKQP